jgi:hypothetical protein
MTDKKPPTVVRLKWEEGLTFTASHLAHTWTLDGKNDAGPSPVIALASALAGCMAIDIVYILTKGRHKVGALDEVVGLAAATGWLGQDLEPRRGENSLSVPRWFVHNLRFKRQTARDKKLCFGKS